MGAAPLIVLIVALNLANLLLARASGRRPEIGVRAAVGASRERSIGQMLAESLLLSFIGGTAGVATAFAGLRALLQSIPRSVPRLTEVNLGWRVLRFGSVIPLLTGLVFGLAPAFHASRSGLLPGIREGSRGSSSGVRTVPFRDALIVSRRSVERPVSLPRPADRFLSRTRPARGDDR